MQSHACLPTTMAFGIACVFSISVLGVFKGERFCCNAEEAGTFAVSVKTAAMGTGAEFTQTGSVEGRVYFEDTLARVHVSRCTLQP